MNEKKVPEIRFQGFSGEWEKQTLDEVVQITMGQSPDGRTYSDTISDYVLVQGNADLKNGWVLPRIWTTQITRMADAGDLIMSVRAPAGAMGKTAYTAVIGRGVAAITGNEFIYQNLVKKDENGFWRTLSCGSTFESLNADNIKNAEIKVPTEKEQTKIGEFFKNLDDLIAQNQKKYDKLVNMKKACLDKMFPKDGADTPEVRFQGCSGEWEKNTLGQVADYIKGYAFQSKEYVGEGVRIIRVSDLTKDNISNEVKKIFIDNRTELYNNYLIYKGDILITTVGSKAELKESAVGRPIIINENTKYLLNQNLVKLSSVKNYCSQFLYNQLLQERYHKHIESIQRGNANQANITIYNLLEYIIKKPTENEQTQIGTFFQTLDNLITLRKTEREKLKNIKKACLDKMFI